MKILKLGCEKIMHKSARRSLRPRLNLSSHLKGITFSLFHNNSNDFEDDKNYQNKTTKRVNISTTVSKVFENKLKILREAIEEIDSELERRKFLNHHFEKQIDGEIEECQDLLGKLPYPWSEGFLPKMEFIRISLHKSLLTRKKDKRTEELKYWDDVVSLLKEKRKLLQEYENLIMTRESLEE